MIRHCTRKDLTRKLIDAVGENLIHLHLLIHMMRWVGQKRRGIYGRGMTKTEAPWLQSIVLSLMEIPENDNHTTFTSEPLHTTP